MPAAQQTTATTKIASHTATANRHVFTSAALSRKTPAATIPKDFVLATARPPHAIPKPKPSLTPSTLPTDFGATVTATITFVEMFSQATAQLAMSAQNPIVNEAGLRVKR
ncbi:hypothetical protein MY4824_004698 [Beauveria thailandica]